MVVVVVFVPLVRLTTRMKEFDADLSVRGKITISSCTLYIVMCRVAYINFVLIHTYIQVCMGLTTLWPYQWSCFLCQPHQGKLAHLGKLGKCRTNSASLTEQIPAEAAHRSAECPGPQPPDRLPPPPPLPPQPPLPAHHLHSPLTQAPPTRHSVQSHRSRAGRILTHFRTDQTRSCHSLSSWSLQQCSHSAVLCLIVAEVPAAQF